MRSSKLEKLQKKEWRDAFVEAEIEASIPFQVRALRKQRGMSQRELAVAAGMKQSRISAIESVGGAKLTLETLQRLASAFDCALAIRFTSFGELNEWSESFDPIWFAVPTFEQELPHLKIAVHVEDSIYPAFISVQAPQPLQRLFQKATTTVGIGSAQVSKAIASLVSRTHFSWKTAQKTSGYSAQQLNEWRNLCQTTLIP